MDRVFGENDIFRFVNAVFYYKTGCRLPIFCYTELQ